MTRCAALLPDIGLAKVLDAETGHEMIIDTSSGKMRGTHALVAAARPVVRCKLKSNDWTSIATNGRFFKGFADAV